MGHIDTSRHHLLFERTAWESRTDATKLRQQNTLIPILERSLHDELHDNCPVVPLLGSRALLAIRNDFRPGNNTMDSIERLLMAIERSTRLPDLHTIERQMAQLAIQAIEIESYYIKGNIVNNNEVLNGTLRS